MYNYPIGAFLVLFSLFSSSIWAQEAEQKNYKELDRLLQEAKKQEGIAYCQALIDLAEQKINQAKQEFGELDSLYARSIYELGHIYDEYCEKQQEAMDYYEQARNLQKQWQSQDYVQSLLAIADIKYYNWQEIEEAQEILQAAIKLQKEKFGKETLLYAKLINSFGLSYKSQGKHKEALALFEEGLALREKLFGKETNDYVVGLNNLGSIYDDMGRYQDAEIYYLEALERRGRILGKENSKYALSLNNLASLYWETGNYSLAEPLYIEALNLRKKVKGEKNLDYTTSLTNLGLLYYSTKDYRKAEKYHTESLKLLQEMGAKSTIYYVIGLNNLAALYKAMGKLEQAKEQYKQALSILGNAHPNYMNLLNNLAVLHMEEKEYEEAKPLFIEAYKLNRYFFGEEDQRSLLSKNNLAYVYYHSEELDTAKLYIRELLQTILDQELGADLNFDSELLALVQNKTYENPLYIKRLVESLQLLHKLYIKENRTAELLPIQKLALQMIKKLRDELTDSKDKLQALELSYDWMLLSFEQLDFDNYANEAFEFMELNKAAILLEAIQEQKAYSFGNLPQELREKEGKIEEQIKLLTGQLHAPKMQEQKDSLRKELGSLRMKRRNLREQIGQDYPEYAALKYEQKDISIQAVQEALQEQTALIEFVVAKHEVYILYIDKQEHKLLRKKIANKDLDKHIDALHQNLSDYRAIQEKPEESFRIYTEEAYWFYEELLKSLLEEKQQIKKLLIVSDAKLGHLPFEVFLKEKAEPGQSYKDLAYLVKSYTISYNYSARLWLENAYSKPKKNNGKILAMAGSYQKDLSEAENRKPVYQRLRATLDDLPSAKQEVEAIQKEYNGRFFFGTESSEQHFKQEAEDYAIVHLALHGIYNSREPLLSSLVFSEDGKEEEDNFLHAYELSQMKLQANLVVLSACETGYGSFEKGNAIASLARAFMFAGASSLIVSLWQVNDASTAHIMQELYAELKTGASSAEALRMAKLSYLEKAPEQAAHPAYWSAFIQLGKDSPLQNKTKGIWLYALAALVALGLAYGFWKSRTGKTKKAA